MTSSSWHGVTTVLMGNCGVTFAPVAADERVFLAEMMESVEDVPRDAILDGLPWDWETYPEYLDSVERMRPAAQRRRHGRALRGALPRDGRTLAGRRAADPGRAEPDARHRRGVRRRRRGRLLDVAHPAAHDPRRPLRARHARPARRVPRRGRRHERRGRRPVPGRQRLRHEVRRRDRAAPRDGALVRRRPVLRRRRQRRQRRHRDVRHAFLDDTNAQRRAHHDGDADPPERHAVRAGPGRARQGQAVEGACSRCRRSPTASPRCRTRRRAPALVDEGHAEGDVVRPGPDLPARHRPLARLQRGRRHVDRRARRAASGCTRSSSSSTA